MMKRQPLQKAPGYDIITRYLENNPSMPSMTLSRLVYKENSEMFQSVERVRGLIRYRRGASGNRNRDDAGLPDRIDLPKSDALPWTPYTIPEQYVNTGIISDLHIPYHSINELKEYLKHFKENGIDSLILNGDIVDFYGISRFCKDPSKKRVKEEIDQLNWFLDYLDDFLPGVKLFYKLGNHEERLDAFLQTHAAELYGLDCLTVTALTEAQQRGMVVIADKRIIKYSGLNILHGHEIGKGFFAPVNPARALYLKTKTTTLMGHLHTSATHHESDMNGKMTTCWSIGCFSELHPAYAPINKWNLGGAILTRDKNGFSVHNHKIINGNIYPA